MKPVRKRSDICRKICSITTNDGSPLFQLAFKGDGFFSSPLGEDWFFSNEWNYALEATQDIPLSPNKVLANLDFRVDDACCLVGSAVLVEKSGDDKELTYIDIDVCRDFSQVPIVNVPGSPELNDVVYPLVSVLQDTIPELDGLTPNAVDALLHNNVSYFHILEEAKKLHNSKKIGLKDFDDFSQNVFPLFFAHYMVTCVQVEFTKGSMDIVMELSNDPLPGKFFDTFVFKSTCDGWEFEVSPEKTAENSVAYEESMEVLTSYANFLRDLLFGEK